MELIPFARAFMGGGGARCLAIRAVFPPASPEKVLQELLLILYFLPVFPGRVLFYNTRINNYSQPLFSKGGQ